MSKVIDFEEALFEKRLQTWMIQRRKNKRVRLTPIILPPNGTFKVGDMVFATVDSGTLSQPIDQNKQYKFLGTCAISGNKVLLEDFESNRHFTVYVDEIKL